MTPINCDSAQLNSDLFRERLAQAEEERGAILKLIEAKEESVASDVRPITLQEATIAAANMKRLIADALADIRNEYL
ncbi:MAG: hypothetical protein ACFB00_12430 [Parvularculaceae bacterium]